MLERRTFIAISQWLTAGWTVDSWGERGDDGTNRLNIWCMAHSLKMQHVTRTV
jgi:hypothetical protein